MMNKFIQIYYIILQRLYVFMTTPVGCKKEDGFVTGYDINNNSFKRFI